MIYHVTKKGHWDIVPGNGYYHHESLAKENFIHACSLQQLPGVLDRYYQNESDLVLLHIDETLLEYPLKYEHSPSLNEAFPHIYGPINASAVVKTETI